MGCAAQEGLRERTASELWKTITMAAQWLLDKICVHVVGDDEEKFMRRLLMAQKSFNLVELRVDYIQDLSKELLVNLRTAAIKDNILTCRSPVDGGRFRGSEADRISILEAGIELEFNHVDIELRVAGQVTKECSPKTKRIVSFHDFRRTPSARGLAKILREINEYQPDIRKIATMVQSDADSVRLLKFLIDHSADQDLIVVGMGRLGRRTRLLSPLLGSYLTFASFDHELRGIPGQVEAVSLKKTYLAIGKLLCDYRS